ncbi:MAG: diaminopimelate epimerase [Desulfovibrio sp.]|nr:diaminopimelate epimerase [Desulfovibrio sp.]
MGADVEKIPFTKMQGAGNDYVYLNGFTQEVKEPGELAVRISDRHFGVGSDGLVIVGPSAVADIRMRMFNADGTEAEMCGNASRCVAKFAHDAGLTRKKIIRLETGAGVKTVELKFSGGEVIGATVDMGEPVLKPGLIPVAMPGQGPGITGEAIEVGGQEYRFTAVSMGNPHAVVMVENPDALDLPVLGPQFENHPWFPRRVNTEFVQVLGRDRIRMRVWERGAGETLACGTGACAALVACVLNGLTDREALVGLRGGELKIRWDAADNHVYMSGPAVTVFEGVYFY